MSVQFNPSKREMIQGLRKRPTYDNVVEIIIKDKVIKLPNRDAKVLRKSSEHTPRQHDSIRKHATTTNGNLERTTKGERNEKSSSRGPEHWDG
jgi:hypothetical protein